ncbi:MAG: anti-sigma factor family protein [Frankiaceae bacterium]
MTHQQQLEIGAYLLGALPPRERSGFEEHLAACAACRNEVADLAGIPALLGKVSLSDVVAAPPASAPDLPRIETRPDPVPEPPGTEPGRVEPAGRRVVPLPAADAGDSGSQAPPPAARPAREPVTASPVSWRHRTVLLAAAAVVAVLAAVASLAVVSGRSGPAAGSSTTPAPAPAAPGDSRTVTLLPTVAGMHGSLVIAGSGTGSVLRLSMGGVRPGQRCSLLVSGGDGARHPVATWTAGYDGDVEMAADSALRPAGIRWVGVTSRDGAVLLQATLAS